VKNKLRKSVVLLGDIAGLYLALFLLMVLRYGPNWKTNWDIHLRPFSLTFMLWILILYGTYLYETRFLRFGIETLRAIGTAVAVSVIASITAFYIFPPGLIYPRRNMVLFAVIFTIMITLWRWSFYKAAGSKIKTNLIFIGGGKEVEELNEYFDNHIELGYNNKGEVGHLLENIETLKQKIKEDEVRLIVVNGREYERFAKHLFPLLASGATVIELGEFYERVTGKVSLETFSDLWFIKNLENINANVYRIAKKSMDTVIGALGTVLYLLLFTPIALIIKVDSPGRAIFKQKRVGKNNEEFMMYKFRTMKALGKDGSAEVNGAQWAREYDSRVTRVGNFLRSSRLDELPQFWNILRGDMSFVGPRPERPEFVEKLTHEIPYYNMRHLVRPGLTGWAQINFPYGDSVDDARAKLQYEIYYAKKLSIALDMAIILKTIRTVITRQGQ